MYQLSSLDESLQLDPVPLRAVSIQLQLGLINDQTRENEIVDPDIQSLTPASESSGNSCSDLDPSENNSIHDDNCNLASKSSASEETHQEADSDSCQILRFFRSSSEPDAVIQKAYQSDPVHTKTRPKLKATGLCDKEEVKHDDKMTDRLVSKASYPITITEANFVANQSFEAE